MNLKFTFSKNADISTQLSMILCLVKAFSETNTLLKDLFTEDFYIYCRDRLLEGESPNIELDLADVEKDLEEVLKRKEALEAENAKLKLKWY